MPEMITMRLSNTVDVMLQLDMGEMYYGEFTVERKRNHIVVTASPRAALLMLDDCVSRSDPRNNWDQPVSWLRTARVAARIIHTAIKTH
jgi:hypothetical protein